MKILSLLPLCIVFLATAPGCSSEAPPAPELSQEEAEAVAEALSVLRAARPEALHAAFARLAETPYSRYTRTAQFAEDDSLLATHTRIARFDGGAEAPTLLHADSSGTFDFGYLGGLVEAADDESTPADLPKHLLPEDPAYLTPRNREAYRYRLLPDTTLWGRATRVVEVEARPGTGDEQPIRRARLYVDRADSVVVALTLERRSSAFFFRENSRLYTALRPASGGGWLPFVTRFDTRLRVPFRPLQRLRTVSAYYDFG